MNTLEIYIKEVHSIKPCTEDWTKEDWAKDKKFLDVVVTTDCWGSIKKQERTFTVEHWDKILSDGYWLG